MRRFTLLFAGVVAVCLLPSVCDADPPAALGQQVGRYQLTADFGGRIYLLDTATGQCWSKPADGRWRDEGNPTQGVEKPKVLPPLSLKLPEDKVKLRIKQRSSKPIPGSDKRILIYLDDITGGQVLISVKADEEKVLLDDVSAKIGDIVQFRVGKKSFYCRITHLENHLIGDDFARIEVAAKRKALGVLEKKPERDEKRAGSE